MVLDANLIILISLKEFFNKGMVINYSNGLMYRLLGN